MKRIIKNPVMMYILGIITCTLTTVLASSLLASDITYKPKDKTWGVTNVQAAVDSLKLAKTSDNYSTNERVIGTWIDGKPLYQKTIVTNAPATANSNLVIASISDISYETIFIVGGYVETSNIVYPLSIEIGSFEDGSSVWIRKEAKTIAMNVNSSRINASVYVTIQYTKTTD
ncbi:MAG: hypothetical protein IJ715_03895 [Bacilli bacterium]|nr:hypothetical protein [Bacilli bacterium]